MRIPLLALVVVAAGWTTASCGDESARDTVVSASTTEFVIELTPSTATGEIVLKTFNAGTLPHELKAVRTDTAPDELPLTGTKVDEAQLDVASRTDELPVGETREVAWNLSSGQYVLICNIEGHYQAGMYAPLTVR